jgi:DnaJ-class molecular chaperone
MTKKKVQRLIEQIEYNRCAYCDGRGFKIITHTSPEGYAEPNEVQECEYCDGTGNSMGD